MSFPIYLAYLDCQNNCDSWQLLLYQHGCCLAQMLMYCDSLNGRWMCGGHRSRPQLYFLSIANSIFPKI